LCWSPLRPVNSNFLLKLFLAIGVGSGISSALFFVCLLLAVSVRHALLVETAVLAILLSILGVSIYKTKAPAVGSPSNEAALVSLLDWKIQWASFLGFVFALTSASYASLSVIWRDPHGDWDAFGIWNLRARFLFRAGDQWRDAFSPILPWSHTDYPLLIPASVARLWKYSGHESIAAPALLALLFTYATVGLTVCGVAALRTRTQGLLAGIVLASTPYFVQLGAAQYGDVPLGFFYLSTIMLLCLQDQEPQTHPRLLVLAGLSAGLAAWTKNEGLLFVASSFLVYALVGLYLRKGIGYFQRMIPFAGGLAPILAVIVLFKLYFGGPSDIFLAPRSMLHQLVDPHRYVKVFHALLRQIFDFGGWVVTPVAMLAFYFLALGREPKSEKQIYLVVTSLALVTTLIGYCIVYVIGPNDIQWWLSNSLSRLLIQLWPSAVFLFFLVARTPEQAGQGYSNF
jgi:hypothetical protein